MRSFRCRQRRQKPGPKVRGTALPLHAANQVLEMQARLTNGTYVFDLVDVYFQNPSVSYVVVSNTHQSNTNVRLTSPRKGWNAWRDCDSAVLVFRAPDEVLPPQSKYSIG